MSPGQAYLVGDDNGRMTPYSEIIVPDQGGYVMNAQQAAAVVSQQTSTVTIEQGAIVINTVPGMNEQAIAANVLTEINRQLGQQAHAQMRI